MRKLAMVVGLFILVSTCFACKKNEKNNNEDKHVQIGQAVDFCSRKCSINITVYSTGFKHIYSYQEVVVPCEDVMDKFDSETRAEIEAMLKIKTRSPRCPR